MTYGKRPAASRPFQALNLGWGVQSWTLAAMSALGHLPRLDLVVHADTQSERKFTYEFAKRWTPWLEEHDIVVRVVSNAQSEEELTSHKTDIPAFTTFTRPVTLEDGFFGEETTTVTTKGMLRRQCTGSWKIEPIKRAYRQFLNEQGLRPTPGIIHAWIGISLDEIERAKPSDVKYITRVHPLLDLKMTRADCEQWLLDHGLEVPPKSSCVFCPFHDLEAWRELKQHPEDWQKAVNIDRAIRDARPPYPLYLHPQRIPLEDVDMTPPKPRDKRRRAQISMWSDECAGVCGV